MMSNFHGTCKVNRGRERMGESVEAHGWPSEAEAQEPMLFDDFKAFKAHVKVCHKDELNKRKPSTIYSRKPVLRTSKPFDPQLGEVGSWVRGNVAGSDEIVTGQVWSVAYDGSPGTKAMYVADGKEFHTVYVSHMTPA